MRLALITALALLTAPVLAHNDAAFAQAQRDALEFLGGSRSLTSK
jgi:hypothetical protein